MSSNDTVRILIVDDHPMMRKGIRDLLELEPDLELAGEAATGEEAIRQAVANEPDVILLDLNMRGMSGLDTLRNLRDADVFCRILVFTVSDNRQDVLACLRNGADGYVLKDAEPEDLLDSIRRVAAGRTVISDELAHVLADAIRQRDNGPSSKLDLLTAREREILVKIKEGLSNKMIGAQLNITEGTVKVHVKNLLKKMNFRSRVEAAVWATENL